ncbi:uncharacterized protein BKA78DRAFT_82988 [Phyllosticta capitalensis]|uniref:uncharacterized protein n=1 Tax=Phyllosticta capitalensis TaxID=121624 RepID=UPI003131C75B
MLMPYSQAALDRLVRPMGRVQARELFARLVGIPSRRRRSFGFAALMPVSSGSLPRPLPKPCTYHHLAWEHAFGRCPWIWAHRTIESTNKEEQKIKKIQHESCRCSSPLPPAFTPTPRPIPDSHFTNCCATPTKFVGTRGVTKGPRRWVLTAGFLQDRTAGQGRDEATLGIPTASTARERARAARGVASASHVEGTNATGERR